MNLKIIDFIKSKLTGLRKRRKLNLNKPEEIPIYLKASFNEKQKEQIKIGIENKLDVLIYAKEYYNASQME